MNPLFLIIGQGDRHIEENNGNKYLIFDSTELHSVELCCTDENKEKLKKKRELLNGIKNEIEAINGGRKVEYGKDFVKSNLLLMIICH